MPEPTSRGIKKLTVHRNQNIFTDSDSLDLNKWGIQKKDPNATATQEETYEISLVQDSIDSMLKAKPIKVHPNSIYAGIYENNSVPEVEDEDQPLSEQEDPIDKIIEVDSEVNIEYNINGATEEDEKYT